MKLKSVQLLKQQIVFLICLICTLVPSLAHEFWISPTSYELKTNDPLMASLRIGENFIGNSYAYNPADYERFEILSQNQKYVISGTLGDKPALNMQIPNDGLAVIINQSKLESLTYKEFDKFEAFALEQDHQHILNQHRARGLPDQDFKEVYRRFAKSYVKLGSGKGADKKLGMELELVALTNPYTSPEADFVKFRLFYLGKPLANTQVSVFVKPEPLADGKLTNYHTDSAGDVSVPKGTGGYFLINSVIIVEPDEKTAAQTESVWYSLWASATYQIK